MVEALTGANYVQAFLDPYYRGILGKTIFMAALVTALCIVLGLPLAQFLARTTSRYKSLLLLCVIVPLFVGNAVRAAGWMVAFGQQGLVNQVGLFSGILDAPVDIMYTPAAVLIGLLSVNLPFVVLTIQSVLEGIDRSAEEASLSLGATSFETWRLVTLPLAMPGVLAAALMSFILAMNAYATPMLLGGPGFRMMAPVVADEILVKNNWPFGATLSLLLIAITTVLTLAINRFLARTRKA
ncbi:ABC transporter permease [Verticiella sediminum]|uniref:ABC transporter permease n=2 Tax=Verticiella sediminum TaxID=1247510 RepID=A0A556B090_9BURK|nr:ABC transporter permease [Verticiella sediminum]